MSWSSAIGSVNKASMCPLVTASTLCLFLKRVKFMGGEPFVTRHFTQALIFPSLFLMTSIEISGFVRCSELGKVEERC